MAEFPRYEYTRVEYSLEVPATVTELTQLLNEMHAEMTTQLDVKSDIDVNVHEETVVFGYICNETTTTPGYVRHDTTTLPAPPPSQPL